MGGRGLKITRSEDLTVDQNEVDRNGGPGLWCDIDCTNAAFTNNRVHHNTRAGIMFEISHYGTITGNAAWENGWGKRSWVWGAGILVSTSDNTEVAHNVVA
jgi:parallel beta-helix repeat protein